MPTRHSFHPFAPLAALAAFLVFIVPSGLRAEGPLKVFLLVGQSNMEGHARLSSFDHIGMDPETAPLLAKMRDADGSPRVLDEVWISYFTGGRDKMGEGHGKLTAGWGSRSNPQEDGGKIAEFTFGITAHEKLEEPVLIIKTAWGGKSINTDFRPPSAGPYVFGDEQIENFKKQGKDLAEIRGAKAEATGKFYRLMIDHVKKVLADPGRVCPAYDPDEGYELSGFVWFQGWNDMVDRGTYPTRDQPGGYDAYSEVLAHFIRDVRKDLGAPELPFVIGVMGAGGPVADYDEGQKRYAGVHQNFRDAMAAPAKLPEFQGNVHVVLTEDCWAPELDVVAKKKGEVDRYAKQLREEGKMSREEQAGAVAKFRAETLSPEDEKTLTGITNADYHYKGSAKVLGRIGVAFAEALVGKAEE